MNEERPGALVPLRVLIIEDREGDAELMVRALVHDGFDPDWRRVDTEKDFVARLDPALDVILSDYHLPGFGGPVALKRLRESGLEIPFVLVSGAIGDEQAVEILKQGAADYLLKDRLARLGESVRHALQQKRLLDEKRRADSALKESEERFRRLAENAPDVIYRYRLFPTRAFEYVSPAATAITGYSPAEHYADPDLSLKIAHPEDRGLLQVLLRGERPCGPVTLRWIRKDGTVIWTEQRNVEILDESGKLVAIEGIARDISELKRTEEALRARNDEIRIMSQQLWQAAKLATLGELAASLAHELNNPLTTMALEVELLLARLSQADPAHGRLEVIEAELERMGKLVANLLRFSRRSSQQISTMDIRDEVERTLDLISFHLRNRRIQVVREFASDVPMIQADRQQLRQLFLNLFTNATDAMPVGGTLTLRVAAHFAESGPHGEQAERPPAARHVRIEVADTGEGIAPDDLGRVMEPFFTTKPEGKGTGLGLPVCRRVVTEHNGSFEIESELGKGTTVRILLPVFSQANGVALRQE